MHILQNCFCTSVQKTVWSEGGYYYLHFIDGKVKIAQLSPTLCDPMDCRVHGNLQARILE